MASESAGLFISFGTPGSSEKTAKCPFVIILSPRVPAGYGFPSADPETSCQAPSSLHDDCAESGEARKATAARKDTARMVASRRVGNGAAQSASYIGIIPTKRRS